MQNTPDDFLNRKNDPEPEPVQGFRVYSSGSNGIPLKAKLFFWSTIAGGIALGTLLFLFFITVFVYVFLPLAAIFLLYQFIRSLKK